MFAQFSSETKYPYFRNFRPPKTTKTLDLKLHFIDISVPKTQNKNLSHRINSKVFELSDFSKKSKMTNFTNNRLS